MSIKKTIQVTQQHINSGVPDCGDFCPIGIAIREQIDHVHDVSIAKDEIIVWIDDGDMLECFMMKTPSELAVFIDAFDNSKPVQPVTFEIDLQKV